MAATEAIRFGKPAQLDGFLRRPTEPRITPALRLLWHCAQFLATDRPTLALLFSGPGELQR
jgi:hypothetical protein